MLIKLNIHECFKIVTTGNKLMITRCKHAGKQS